MRILSLSLVLTLLLSGCAVSGNTVSKDTSSANEQNKYENSYSELEKNSLYLDEYL